MCTYELLLASEIKLLQKLFLLVFLAAVVVVKNLQG